MDLIVCGIWGFWLSASCLLCLVGGLSCLWDYIVACFLDWLHGFNLAIYLVACVGFLCLLAYLLCDLFARVGDFGLSVLLVLGPLGGFGVSFGLMFDCGLGGFDVVVVLNDCLLCIFVF